MRVSRGLAEHWHTTGLTQVHVTAPDIGVRAEGRARGAGTGECGRRAAGGGAAAARRAGREAGRAHSAARRAERRTYPRARAMVARTDEMFGCYGDSYSYRLWSLANVWGACRRE
ncbi:hypothetical protein RR48_05619 [Papilio machaon]|uniref:Uncharacterized protein n=1 Tax=Papilio machaon TaxID=76193 RepID=A0A0N1PJN0_PAPMA|nr:hypothetical protein RR48_05619 [Papilio machaon]